MGSAFAIIAAICVPSFFVFLVLARRAPEMDVNGRIVTGRRKVFRSPSIVPLNFPEEADASHLPTGRTAKPSAAVTR